METIMEKNEQTHWADDVIDLGVSMNPTRATCDFCGSERMKSLWERCGKDSSALCESCATLSKEDREKVRQSKYCDNLHHTVVVDEEDKPIPYLPTGKPMLTFNIRTLKKKCPDPRYEGSLWCYAGEGFRMHWNGRQWNLRCTKPWSEKGNSVFEDEDPVALEMEGFWELIEYGGCVSVAMKPEPRKLNINKAPRIKTPVDTGW